MAGGSVWHIGGIEIGIPRYRCRQFFGCRPALFGATAIGAPLGVGSLAALDAQQSRLRPEWSQGFEDGGVRWGGDDDDDDDDDDRGV